MLLKLERSDKLFDSADLLADRVYEQAASS